MFPWLAVVPWRLVGWGAAAAAVLLLGWRIHAWREAYQALPAAQEALQNEIECGEGSNCAERVAALQARSEAVSATTVARYEDEIAKLRDRPPVRRVIRVCPPADPGDLRHADATGAADGAGPTAGELLGSVELDTAPLRDLARDADEVAARLRALQEWNRALAGR